jgi:hypothetical protein
LTGPWAYQKIVLFTFILQTGGTHLIEGLFLAEIAPCFCLIADPAGIHLCRWLRLRFELYNQFHSRKKNKNVTIIVFLYHFTETAMKHDGFLRL